jgi:hypothetical protein
MVSLRKCESSDAETFKAAVRGKEQLASAGIIAIKVSKE